MRLGGAQPGQVIGEGGVPAAGPAELAAGTRLDLPVHSLIRLALDNLAGDKAEGLRPGPHHRPGGSPARAALR
jgi:hypothetical protein